MSHAGLVEGKVAVVTGVGPGLGRASALALARETISAKCAHRVPAPAKKF